MARKKHFRRFLTILCAFAIIIGAAAGTSGAVPAAEAAETFPKEEAFSRMISRVESALNGLYALILKGGAGQKSLHLEIEPATLRLLNVASEAVIKADSSWIKSLYVDLIPGETDLTFVSEYNEYNYEPITIQALGMAGRLCLNEYPVLEAGLLMNERGLTLALPRVVDGGYSLSTDERTALTINDALRAFMHCADLLPSAETVAKVVETLEQFTRNFQPEEIEEGPAGAYYDNVYATVRFYKGTLSSKKLLETLSYIMELLEGDETLKGQIDRIFKGLKEYPYLSGMMGVDEMLRDLAYAAEETDFDPEEAMPETEEDWAYETYEYETEEDFSDEAGDLILGALKEESLDLIRNSESMLDDFTMQCALLYDLQGHLIGLTVGGDMYTGSDSLLDIRWIVNEDPETNDSCVFSISSLGRQLLLLTGYKDPETEEYCFSFPVEYLADGLLDSLYYQRYQPSSISFRTTGIKLGTDGTLTGTLVLDKIPGFTLPQGMVLEICFDKGTVTLLDDTAVYLTLNMTEAEETDAKEIEQILVDTNRQHYAYNFTGNWNVLAITNRLLDAGMPQDFFKAFPVTINGFRFW